MAINPENTRLGQCIAKCMVQSPHPKTAHEKERQKRLEAEKARLIDLGIEQAVISRRAGKPAPLLTGLTEENVKICAEQYTPKELKALAASHGIGATNQEDLCVKLLAAGLLAPRGVSPVPVSLVEAKLAEKAYWNDQLQKTAKPGAYTSEWFGMPVRKAYDLTVAPARDAPEYKAYWAAKR